MRTVLGILLVLSGLTVPAAVAATPAAAPAATRAAADCPPSSTALGFSDALDKLTRDGVTLGGLSNLAWDRATRSYAATVDNHGTDPARIWFFRRLADPVVTRDPLVLRRPDGTPYTGEDADDEGLAILPHGRFVVSSETEPVIRIFGRDGVQQHQITVPRRLRVAPVGQATANATLEGLTLSHGRLIASMEGALSGDGGATSTYHRLLVFRRHGDTFRLARQVGYRARLGNRIAEVQAFGRDGLLVLEAAFTPGTGNSIELYGVRRLSRARDVSRVADLSTAPRRDVVRKRLVSDVTSCPSLGATSKEQQTNPLMDNYEGMLVQPHRHSTRVTLISDDNFSATQTTRLLRLRVRR